MQSETITIITDKKFGHPSDPLIMIDVNGEREMEMLALSELSEIIIYELIIHSYHEPPAKSRKIPVFDRCEFVCNYDSTNQFWVIKYNDKEVVKYEPDVFKRISFGDLFQEIMNKNLL